MKEWEVFYNVRLDDLFWFRVGRTKVEWEKLVVTPTHLSYERTLKPRTQRSGTEQDNLFSEGVRTDPTY